MSPASMYTTRTMATRDTVIVSHETMAHLLSYLQYQNLVLETPECGLPYVEVLRADGSPLDEAELARVAEVANRAKFAKRVHEGIGSPPQSAHEAMVGLPETGAMHASIAQLTRGNQ